jgi:hypothetical protein
MARCNLTILIQLIENCFTFQLKINPRPWTANWHTWDLKGVELEGILAQLSERRIRRYNTFLRQTGRDHQADKYDLMKQYRYCKV